MNAGRVSPRMSAKNDLMVLHKDGGIHKLLRRMGFKNYPNVNLKKSRNDGYLTMNAVFPGHRYRPCGICCLTVQANVVHPNHSNARGDGQRGGGRRSSRGVGFDRRVGETGDLGQKTLAAGPQQYRGPRAASRGNAANKARLWAEVLPNPIPGSIAMRAGFTPAAAAMAARFIK